jgi:hypothetical protein
MKYLSSFVLCICTLFFVQPLFSQSYGLETSLGLGAQDSQYGACVDISGEIVAIGAPSEDINTPYIPSIGSVSIRRLVNGNWIQTQKMLSPDSIMNSNFGRSLAIDDGHLLVGTETGKIYSFENSDEIWKLNQEFERPEEDSLISNFGRKIDLMNNSAVISSDGSIHIYSLDSEGFWHFIQKVYKEGVGFGTAIALNSDFLAVSAPGESSVYIYKRNAQGNYDEIQKITAAEQNTEYGLGLAISSEWLAIRSSDSVQVLQFENNLWKDFQKITIEKKEGSSISINKSILVIGVEGLYSEPQIPGYVDVYEFTDTIWKKTEEVHPSDGVVFVWGGADRFGSAVALSESFLIVGAPNKYEGPSEFEDYVTGKAYVFMSADIAFETFEEACDQYVFDDELLSSSGIYWSKDSTQVLNLTIIESPVSSIQICNNAFFADEMNAHSYQWFNCLDSIPILGAVTPYFYPVNEGSYFLSLTTDGCTSISECNSFVPETQEIIYPGITKSQSISASSASDINYFDQSVVVHENTLMAAVNSVSNQKFTDIYVKKDQVWEFHQRLEVSGKGGIDLYKDIAITWENSASIITKNENSTWELSKEVYKNDFSNNVDNISEAAIRSNISLIGANYYSGGGGAYPGRVYVLDEQTDWMETGSLRPLDTNESSGDQFGDRIVILDESVIISAPFAGHDFVTQSTDPPFGLIFSYQRNTNSLDKLSQTISPPKSDMGSFTLYDADENHLIAGPDNLYSYIKGCNSRWYLSQSIEGNYLEASVNGNYLAASKEDSTDVFTQNNLNQWELLSSVVGGITSVHANTMAVINEDVIDLYELNDNPILSISPELMPAKNIIVNIWPNPAKDFVTFELNQRYPSFKFYLYDAKGLLINHFIYTDSQSFQYRASIDSGLYFVRIQTSEGSEVTKRLLIE